MDDPIHLSSADHARERECGSLVYPVLSRRSGGLSLGINLFPDRKLCNFDCPYCEIFPFETPRRFEPDALVRDLARFFERERPTLFSGMPLRDICLSGNGEPTLSPFFAEAVDAALAARDCYEPEAELVLITNATRLGEPSVAAFLGERMDGPRLQSRRLQSRRLLSRGLRVWAKLDAGTEAVYRRMNRATLPFERLVAGLRSFAAAHEIVVQSMFCRVDGVGPSEEELGDYGTLAASLVAGDARIAEFHLYTQARPAPEGRSSALDDAALLALAEDLRGRFASCGAPSVPTLRVFGESGELTGASSP